MLTPEIEARGLQAYEQAGAFEQLKRRRWLPVAYGIFPLLPVMGGYYLLQAGHTAMAGAQLMASLVFIIGLWQRWRWLSARHLGNQRLLAEMEAAYGDRLPWVQVEKHFAALERLKEDLAEERRRGEGDFRQEEHEG